jgi:pimeloyl-ACP methyl ester carboxylesterase
MPLLMAPAGPAPGTRRRGVLVWASRTLLALLAIAVLLPVVGALYEAVMARGDAARYPAPGQLVDVGGHRLHLHCTGEGGPTVVLASGAGGFSAEWALVQPDLAKTNRVCVFDRAGLGWSEAGPAPRSPGRIADELHALLTTAGVPGPYVLVAHSAGARSVRLFTQRHPELVAGMVLVDPRSEYVDDRLSPEQVAAERREVEEFEGMIESASRFGLVRLIWAQVWPEFLPSTANLSPQTRDVLGMLQARGQHLTTGRQEYEAAWADNDELRDASLGDVPLAVIGAGQMVDRMPYWPESLEYQASLSARGELIVAKGVSHSIHWERPELVVSAVRAIVGAAR